MHLILGFFPDVLGGFGGWDMRRWLVVWQLSLLKFLLLRVVLHIIIIIELKTNQIISFLVSLCRYF